MFVFFAGPEALDASAGPGMRGVRRVSGLFSAGALRGFVEDQMGFYGRQWGSIWWVHSTGGNLCLSRRCGRWISGGIIYAVQTFNDIPQADGRRIQIAWMRDGKYPGMPFNQQMSFPAELTLHSTADGPRLFRNPVREIDLLHGAEHRWTDAALKPGGDLLTGSEW